MKNTGEKEPQAIDGNGEVSNDYVVKYTGLLSMVQVLTMFVSVIRNKVASAMLFTAGVGLSSLYSNTVNFLFNATNFGLSFSAIKHMAEVSATKDERTLSHYVEVIRTWSVWSAGLGALVCVACAPLVSRLVFKDAAFTVPAASLSLMVAFMAITGGEMAILKAVRRLKRVALISSVSACATLACTVPFYYFMGMDGILPALMVSTGVVMLVHLRYTIPVFPWRVSLWNSSHFREGISMVRLGVPYLLSGLMNAVTCMGVSVYIHHVGNLSDVGMYGMGYNLIFVYGTLLFASVESDFFPRLTSLHKDLDLMNSTINQQIRVCVLLMGPFLTLLMVGMPIIVRLLYTTEFLPIVPMATVAAVHLLFKALTLPVAYLPLAKNESLLFLLMEVLYDMIFVAAVLLGYHWNGLTGTGVGIAAAGILDWLMIYKVYRHRYGFTFEKTSLPFVLRQFVCVFAALAGCMHPSLYVNIGIGIPAVTASCCFSIQYIRQELTLLTMLKEKFITKFNIIKKR